MTDPVRLARPNKVAFVAGRALAKVTWFARPLPDAVVIGSVRAGTTALYAYLLQHPKVKGPFGKELHYLDLKWDRGESWYRSQFPLSLGRRDWVAIEGTPVYLAYPPALDRMLETVPEARFIVTVRDPVERAISHWRFRTQRGLEDRTLEDVIATETSAQSEPGFGSLILTHGHYAEHLERWFDRVDRAQFHIVDAHDLFTDPVPTMGDVCEFLGVEARPDLGTNVRNASDTDARPSDAAVDRLREHYAPHDERLAALLDRRLSWMGA